MSEIRNNLPQMAWSVEEVQPVYEWGFGLAGWARLSSGSFQSYHCPSTVESKNIVRLGLLNDLRRQLPNPLPAGSSSAGRLHWAYS